MEILEVRRRSGALLEQLLELWERSVRASHTFLSPAEISAIRPDVPGALTQVPHLVIARERETPLGFLGAEGRRLEMLFLEPEARGRGIGTALVRYALDAYSLREVTVNEQNIAARGFYERLGFRTVRRTPLDEQGRPYPLLYMELPEP